jgi:hypothetical protein
LGASADYAALNRIMEELEYAEQIMKKSLFNDRYNNRAVEETPASLCKRSIKGVKAMNKKYVYLFAKEIPLCVTCLRQRPTWPK